MAASSSAREKSKSFLANSLREGRASQGAEKISFFSRQGLQPLRKSRAVNRALAPEARDLTFSAACLGVPQSAKHLGGFNP